MDLALIPITLVGCLTVIILVALDKFGGNKQQMFESELRHAHELIEQKAARIVELERLNDQLQQQLDWQGKLVEAQDRTLKQLADGTGNELPTSPQHATVRR